MTPPPSSPKVLVVIVNYRTPDLTIDCLESLEPEITKVSEQVRVEVLVTDNASPDDSVPRLETVIQSRFQNAPFRLLPLDQNGGFAFGNNAAIRPSMESDDPPEYIWLLNPDTVVRPGALDELLEFMDVHPEVGIAGSRLEDPDGTPQRSAFRFHTILSELEAGFKLGPLSRVLSRWTVAPPIPAGNAPSPTDWVAGASMIIRREVIQQAGLLDESYFMYFEEVDFCRVAAKKGWPCYYVPKSRVVHLVGQASGVTDPKAARKRRPKYWFASRRRYFLRHQGLIGTVLADFCWTIGYSTFLIRKGLTRTAVAEPEALLGDFVRYNFSMGLGNR